jgi:Ca2+-transporting ATPase
VTWLELFKESFEDTTIIVLVVAALVSFVVGVYEDPSKGWIEGVAILAAVLIVAVVTATNNYNKELQFRKLNAVKDDVSVQVVRDGNAMNINVKELVVGDVVLLNAGDRIPADGLLLDGSDVAVNESSLTGESDDKKKHPRNGNNHSDEDADIFLLSGNQPPPSPLSPQTSCL